MKPGAQEPAAWRVAMMDIDDSSLGAIALPVRINPDHEQPGVSYTCYVDQQDREQVSLTCHLDVPPEAMIPPASMMQQDRDEEASCNWNIEVPPQQHCIFNPLPAEIMLKCVPHQKMRLECRAVCKEFKAIIQALPHEWSLSQLATDDTLKHLAQAFPNLHAVSVNHGGELGYPCRKISSAGMKWLASLASLKKLELHYVTSLEEEDLAVLAGGPQRLPLGTLVVEHALSVTDISASAVASVCPGLTSLTLVSSHVSDDGIKEVAKHCGLLTSFSISNCHAITDEGIIAISEGCQLLKNLQVTNSQHLTDDGLVAIAERCLLLHTLNISRSQNVKDRALEAIGKRCTRLISLDISWCVQVGDEGLIHIARGCPNLRELKHKGCSKLTDTAFAEVAANCRNMSSSVRRPTSSCFEVPESARVCASRSRGLCEGWFSSCMPGC